MKKVFFAATFLLLLADIILLKEITFLRKDNCLLKQKNGTGASKEVSYAPENSEILDKTQLLFMNIP